MAITLHSNVSTASPAAGASRALPALALTAGRFVLVAVSWEGASALDTVGTLSGVSDDLGNIYTPVASTGTAAEYVDVRWFIASVTNAGSATITATFNATPAPPNSVEMLAVEASGLDTAATPVIACVTSRGATATQPTGSVEVAGDTDFLLLSAHEIFTGTTNQDYSGWTNGFTELADLNGGQGIAFLITDVPGSYSTTPTNTRADEWYTSLVALRGQTVAEPTVVEGTGTASIGTVAAGAAVSVAAGTYAIASAGLDFVPALPIGGNLHLAGTSSSLTSWVQVVAIDGAAIYVIDAQVSGEDSLVDLVETEIEAVDVRHYA